MGGNMQDDFVNRGRTVPFNFGPMRDPDGNARIKGPCGDTMEFWIRGADGRVGRVTYTTDGCGNSMLAGSVAGRIVEGMTAHEARRITQEDVLAGIGEFPEESRHCALLAANTVRAAVDDYIKRNALDEDETAGTGTGGRTAPGEGAGSGAAGESAERAEIGRAMAGIRHKIMVLSGKGGVGKSTVAVNLAASLVLAGKRTGLLDVDMHGPSIPKMLGMEGVPVTYAGPLIVPPEVGGLKAMSIGFFLQNRDDAVIWRGPMKMGVIKQFLKDVEWGDLDYLIIDSPPGTGDEPLSICQLIPDADGAAVVTTPQNVATADARKSINFCRAMRMPILGVIENMSGYVCPKCGKAEDIFRSGGGEQMAREMDVPFLGRIPIEPAIGVSCDDGKPYVHCFARTETAKAFAGIVARIAGKPD
jgi:Mrp family chromosome partitioning ATPase